MKHNLKFSVVAVVLAVIMAVSSQADMFLMAKLNMKNTTEDAKSIQTSSVINVASDINKKNNSIDTLESFDNYKSDDSVFDNISSVDPDTVLPSDKDVEDVESDKNYTEKDGVTIIPVKINNSIRDSLSSVISQNVYTFSVDERGVIIYAFNHKESDKKQCMWYITLYEEYSPDGTEENISYRAVERVTYSNIGEPCKSTTIGVSPGNYRVSVECVSGFTGDKYELAIGFAAVDNYEIEPNNSKTRYTELSLDVPINGSASVTGENDTDVDWYMFEITDDGYAVLYFEHETDTQAESYNHIAWRIKLTDMNGNEYFYSTSGMESENLNSGVMGISKGYYFVTVYSHVFSGVTYSLSVSFTKDSTVETELNDSFETANPIEINTEKVGSLTARNDASDRDYYSFNMDNDGFVVIDFIHEKLSENKDGWHITVLDEQGNIAYTAVSDWSQNIMQSPNIGLSVGKYYILIDSDNIYHNSIVYRLILLSQQDSSWETEPNNTPSTADAITFGKPINGTLIDTGTDYDKDYYVFDTDNDGTLQVSFNHIRTDNEDKEGWIVSVIDINGNVISSTSVNWNSEEITFTANLEKGKYFILVETGLFFNSNRYMLNAEFG